MNLIPKTASGSPDAIKALAVVPESAIWLANYTSKRTRVTYSRAVKDFVRFIGLKSETDWQIVGQAHVIAWRDDLIKSGKSERTINAHLSALSSMFKHLCEKQVVGKNPVDGIRRAQVNQDRVQTSVLTREQVRRMIDAPGTRTLKGLRDTAILCTLFYTGCRIAEVCSIKVRDFFEDAGYMVLDFKIKGGKRNKIAIHQELVAVLNEYLRMSGHGEDREKPLFLPVQRPDERGHLNSSQVNRIFHQHARKVNLPKGVRPHSARATFITEALEHKCPIEAVQRSVGHAHISTTQMYDKRILRHRESASFAVQY